MKFLVFSFCESVIMIVVRCIKSNFYNLYHVQYTLLYLINIHWLSVDFDWSRACHVEGAILSCRMIILPSDVISALKRAAALVVTCVLFTVHVEGAILSCRMIILPSDIIFA